MNDQTAVSSHPEPSRADIDALGGPTLLEVGASWCPHCAAAQPLIAQVLEQHPRVRHIRIEDAKGRPLGRSFQVKLWPTLIYLLDGREIARVVRPRQPGELLAALQQLQ